MAWNGLPPGVTTLPATAMNGEPASLWGELQGKFDASGEVCFDLPTLGANYVAATLSGVRNARLLDENNRRLRTLLAGVPTEGEQTLLFALPVNRASALLLHGDEGTWWYFRWRMKEAAPLALSQTLEPLSPRLQQLAQELAAGGSTAHFWREREREGTPLIEPIDGERKRVTFLWRGASYNVFLLGSPSGECDPLFRLDGSDVWFRSYIVPADTLMQYQLAPDVPQVDGCACEQRRAVLISAQADPLNPQSIHSGCDRWSRYSLLALAPAPFCTGERMARPLRSGTLTRHSLRSDFLHNTREILLYRPRIPQPARWTLIVIDGKRYQDEYRFANVLDSLIASHALPPVNVVFVDSAPSRRAQELSPNLVFADFMAHELSPWLRRQGLELTRQKTVLAGSGSGGLAACWVALRYPRRFANVLSLSAAYGWAPPGEEAGWLPRCYQLTPRYPLRFWLHAGTFETAGPGGGVYRSTQAFADILHDKGYAVSVHSSSGGHDYAAWCEALVAAMRDFTGLGRAKIRCK